MAISKEEFLNQLRTYEELCLLLDKRNLTPLFKVIPVSKVAAGLTHNAAFDCAKASEILATLIADARQSLSVLAEAA